MLRLIWLIRRRNPDDKFGNAAMRDAIQSMGGQPQRIDECVQHAIDAGYKFGGTAAKPAGVTARVKLAVGDGFHDLQNFLRGAVVLSRLALRTVFMIGSPQFAAVPRMRRCAARSTLREERRGRPPAHPSAKSVETPSLDSHQYGLPRHLAGGQNAATSSASRRPIP